jgi:hypothetical protein
VLNVAPPLKKAQQPIIGHQMANSTAYPVESLNTGNFSQQQPMKKFIMALVTLMPANHSFIFNPAWQFQAFFYVNNDLFVLQTFINLI